MAPVTPPPESPGGGVLRSARPDQLVLPVALDQVGVDPSSEAGVVELHADELATAIAGAGPACADLDLADEYAVVRSGFAALLDRGDRRERAERDKLRVLARWRCRFHRNEFGAKLRTRLRNLGRLVHGGASTWMCPAPR